jgi:hypothetical protein
MKNRKPEQRNMGGVWSRLSGALRGPARAPTPAARFDWLRFLAAAAQDTTAWATHDDVRATAARLAVFGGRENLPLSLGSVYAAAVARFLPMRYEGTVVRTVALDCETFGRTVEFHAVAFSADASTLFVAAMRSRFDRILAYDTATGAVRCTRKIYDGVCLSAATPDGCVFATPLCQLHVLTRNLDVVAQGTKLNGGYTAHALHADATDIVMASYQCVHLARCRDAVFYRRFTLGWSADLYPRQISFVHWDDTKHIAVSFEEVEITHNYTFTGALTSVSCAAPELLRFGQFAAPHGHYVLAFTDGNTALATLV